MGFHTVPFDNMEQLSLQIFSFQRPRGDAFFLDWHNSMRLLDRTPAPCSVNPEHVGGTRSKPLHFVPKDQAVGDIMWVGPDCVISSHGREVLSAARLTGIDYEIAIAHPGPSCVDSIERLGPLYSIRVLGWGGIARAESGVRLVEKCEGCGRQQFTRVTDWSKVFDEASWDGSDAFMIWPMVNSIFITDRFVSVLNRHKFKYARCIEIETLKLVDYGFAIGPLSQYMSDDLARDRGEPRGLYWQNPQLSS
jgi:hypothetical protein